MSALVQALLADLGDDELRELAERLRPHLTPIAADPGTPLTVARIAARTGVSQATIRRALAAGLLTGHQAAGRWRATANAVPCAS